MTVECRRWGLRSQAECRGVGPRPSPKLTAHRGDRRALILRGRVSMRRVPLVKVSPRGISAAGEPLAFPKGAEERFFLLGLRDSRLRAVGARAIGQSRRGRLVVAVLLLTVPGGVIGEGSSGGIGRGTENARLLASRRRCGGRVSKRRKSVLDYMRYGRGDITASLTRKTL